jgi:intracellular sulfur oxidation DsrE/DsrF family protein
MVTSVVFHWTPGPRAHALRNVSNLIDALNGEPWAIEVLANGEAVRFYVSDDAQTDAALMSRLAARGVVFAACNNALRANRIAPESLPEFVKVVPAGGLELARKQREGYAYIKV